MPTDQLTIQLGIINAKDGDTVLVAPGRYRENIYFRKKKIVVGSYFLTSRDTSYISQTIIDGLFKERVITFEEREDSNTVLTGFSITNGYASQYYSGNSGGGIYCGYLSSPRLEYLRIYNNYAEFGGGGIFCYALSFPKISSVEIYGNYANRGGGVYFEYETKPVFENVSIHHNNVVRAGGGIYCYDGTDILMKNITLYKNSAEIGGGIHCYDCSPLIMNATIVNNTAYLGGGINCGQLSSPKIINSIVWDNLPQNISFSDVISSSGPRSLVISHCDIQGGKQGIYVSDDATLFWFGGNINSDPSFMNSDINNFQLNKNSPCIDAGIQDTVLYYDKDMLSIPSSDYAGISPDMGAFESDYPLTIDKNSFPPNDFLLDQNFPNPFNQQTHIRFTVPQNGDIKITIFDLGGKIIAILANHTYAKGTHQIVWNGENLSGNPVASGLYICSLSFEEEKITTRKMILIK